MASERPGGAVSQGPRHAGLLAALSFEDRCIASLAQWRATDAGVVKSAVYFSYDDQATPSLRASGARESNWLRITDTAKSSGISVSRCPLDPYSMGALESYIDAAGSEYDKIVVDLSCFTKVHLMAVARAVLKLGAGTAWSICYSSPFSYGDLNNPVARGGWQDNLVLPLGDDPSLTKQGMAVGVLLAGIEADRAAIAMSALEPASGLIVVSCTEGRPDMHRLAMANNSLLFTHLRNLRMPGPLGKEMLPYFPSGGWETEKVYMNNVIEGVPGCLRKVVHAAAALNAPIVLFPFGPKIVIFVASLYLARHYPAASWAIYPVPKTHPLDYSDGTRVTDWYSDREILRGVDEAGTMRI
jgi:hypothetical protein